VIDQEAEDLQRAQKFWDCFHPEVTCLCIRDSQDIESYFLVRGEKIQCLGPTKGEDSEKCPLSGPERFVIKSNSGLRIRLRTVYSLFSHHLGDLENLK
jgi:hypothetical protein